MSVNVVLVREPQPPEGDLPVEWLLLTSLPIDDIEHVRQVIEYYCVRWMVEVFFRTLKSGCRAEERRFEQIDRQLRCLAVYLIIAWRTLYVCRLGRACPEIQLRSDLRTGGVEIGLPSRAKQAPAVQAAVPGRHRTDDRATGQATCTARAVTRQVHKPFGSAFNACTSFALCWQLFGPRGHNRHVTCVEQRAVHGGFRGRFTVPNSLRLRGFHARL